MRRKPKSLAFRLTLTATIWCLVVLVAAAIALTGLYRQTALEAFERELDLYVLNLIAVADLTGPAETVDMPDLGNPRFGSFQSGWFWQIAEAGADRPILQSQSAAGRSVAMPPASDVPYDGDFRRVFDVAFPDAGTSRVVERIILVEGRDVAVTFAVGGAMSEVTGQANAFFRLLSIALAIVGVGLVVAMALVIRFGLRPVRDIRAQLSAIRSGNADRLSGDYPDELEPLAEELNTLFDANDRIIDRARTQAGNLAHALKTPLAVLHNETSRSAAIPSTLVRDQVGSMRQQVDYHLNRARIAATTSARKRHPIDESLSSISRTLARIQRDRSIDVDLAGTDGLVFRGEREDFEEMVGNLLENAFKWASQTIRIDRQGLATPGNSSLAITIADDGPGVPDGELSRIVERGRRLDETTPGTGLGLSIVADLVDLYGGQIEFGRSDLGGLMVRVELPAA